MWAYLRVVEQQPVHKKRLLRLRREPQLLVQPNMRLQARRSSAGRTPRPTKPYAWRGIEMTKVWGEGVGWIYIVVILDCYTKMIVGY